MDLIAAATRSLSVAGDHRNPLADSIKLPARGAAALPNELWMLSMAHLDAAEATAARAVNKNFCQLIDTVHPELLLPKASRLYQSRPKLVDSRLVEGILKRAKTLTFRDTPGNKIITVPKFWDTERCTEPERIWQMVKWAPRLLDLTISHADALSDDADELPTARLPAGLQHLCLEGAHGSMLHPRLFDNLFENGLAHLQSLHLERLHLMEAPAPRRLGHANLFPQLTSLELQYCYMSAQMNEVLADTNVCTLRNLALHVIEEQKIPHGPSLSPATSAAPAVLQFIDKNRTTLERLVLVQTPPLNKGTVTAWLTQEAWPALQSLRFSGLRLDAQELRMFGTEAFSSLTRLRLADTQASQESLRMMGQMQGRRWAAVTLGPDDWIDMTRAHHASWLLEPAFAKLHTARLRLSLMSVQAAQEIVLRFGQHIMCLSLTSLNLDAVGMASLASVLDRAYLPHLTELEITAGYLEVPGVYQILAQAPFQVWVEPWDEDGALGFYL